MRLLKTGPYPPGKERLELIEKYGKEIPDYAILSHTWDGDEVLFADIQNHTAHHRKAYRKITAAFDQARKDGYGFIWIDTCCINKDSSAELSEAINSMYTWYMRSKKCYAFLADVSDADLKAFDSQFRKSRWFRRGWTLQELLAPTDLEFFSRDWEPLGDRIKLQILISDSTTIGVDYLTGYRPIQQASLAARMSWAANRETTREEDAAYCLMGLFAVNMPMLYGEGGERAFIRLQEAIMSHSDDHSIFAWTDPSYAPSEKFEPDAEKRHGLLADSPRAFAQCGSIIPWDNTKDEAPYNMSNRGLGITLPLVWLSSDTCVAALECHQSFQDDRYLGIYLRKLTTGGNQFARYNCHKLGTGLLKTPGQSKRLFIRQSQPNEQGAERKQFFQLRGMTSAAREYAVVDMLYPSTAVDNDGNLPHETSGARAWIPLQYPTIFAIPKGHRKLAVAILLSRRTDGEMLALLMGSITEYEVGFFVCDPTTLDGQGGWDQGYGVMQRAFAAGVCQAGEMWRLECHHVHADMRPHVQQGRKIYVVDIDVKPYAKRRTEDVAEKFLDALADSPVQKFGKVSSLFRRGRD
ncbi:hypothetical protein LTR10_004521 [Elasticomyces elasticus]|nr:hypothetical protein LTR10_004521 [Elasticomyces elasticus]KAK4976840.1 hypothetical protein LTR42_002885 [Elasticomyces elasticus]